MSPSSKSREELKLKEKEDCSSVSNSDGWSAYFSEVGFTTLSQGEKRAEDEEYKTHNIRNRISKHLSSAAIGRPTDQSLADIGASISIFGASIEAELIVNSLVESINISYIWKEEGSFHYNFSTCNRIHIDERSFDEIMNIHTDIIIVTEDFCKELNKEQNLLRIMERAKDGKSAVILSPLVLKYIYGKDLSRYAGYCITVMNSFCTQPAAYQFLKHSDISVLGRMKNIRIEVESASLWDIDKRKVSVLDRYRMVETIKDLLMYNTILLLQRILQNDSIKSFDTPFIHYDGPVFENLSVNFCSENGVYGSILIKIGRNRDSLKAEINGTTRCLIWEDLNVQVMKSRMKELQWSDNSVYPKGPFGIFSRATRSYFQTLLVNEVSSIVTVHESSIIEKIYKTLNQRTKGKRFATIKYE